LAGQKHRLYRRIYGPECNLQNGISRASSKASQIGEPLEAVCEEYDLKTAYDEKNGVPTSAAPKVFMKYFFVNTVTGEKSGEMLAVVSLKEDAAGEQSLYATSLFMLAPMVCWLSGRGCKIDNGKSFSVFQYRKESLSLRPDT